MARMSPNARFKGWTMQWPTGEVVDPVYLHDIFNLITIGILNVLNVAYLIVPSSFLLFWTASMVYFFLDTLFIGLYPSSVKSPVVILVHHMITAAYMVIPYHYPMYQWCMSYCMLVEMNTWLLIARRNMKWEVMGVNVLEMMFYISWVGLRNLWYPYLIYAFYLEWVRESQRCGSPWNIILLTPIFQTFFTGLNYYWTLPLVRSTLSKRTQASKLL